ncbi:ArnT family glycosyltransferase [Shimazuella kribbensis]|uniref:ArnT family glycosyltransferase n=1 Tax=Shimazuella kribbensis TaxID=139808 RepID=UPI0003F5ADC3|nr:glycosyltransferase family 39 protein [Shimazuella kribbensis]
MTEEIKQEKRLDWFLVVIAILSAFLNFFNVWNQNSDNAYYTAAVTSMLQSFHNFFFASFDPGGFVTVDKPPVSFWVQTAFAFVFGVHGWSVVLPQALAGVGSVLLVYVLVKRSFGITAAQLAGLVMACSPIAVVISRTNNIDSLLVFTLLVGVWMLFKGIRLQKVSWILGAFAMIGVGFNIKMLQAYLVVPAFYVFYLIAFKAEWKKRLTVLLTATVIMIGVSLSWAIVVDSIPAKDRPYVGSSKTNSVLELALGYNGLSRLTGNQGNGLGQTPPTQQPPTQQPAGNNVPSMTGGDGNAGLFGTGFPGPLRLFQKELSGQISWLIPFVLFGCVGLLSGIRRKQPLTDKQKETLFWLAWLIPGMVFFSAAGFFHHYYLVMLAPPIAALVGTGWVELCNQYKNKVGWKTWLLPSAIVATTAFELYVLWPYQEQIGIVWSIVIGVLGISISLILYFANKQQKWNSWAALAGIMVMLIAPLYWSSIGLMSGVNSFLPQSGPNNMDLAKGKPAGGSIPNGNGGKGPVINGPIPNGSGGQGAGQGPALSGPIPNGNGGQGPVINGPTPNGNSSQGSGKGPAVSGPVLYSNGGQGVGKGMSGPVNTTNGSGTSGNRGPSLSISGGAVDEKLLAYVTKHNKGEKFLFATPDSQLAAPYIIKTGKSVMAMGGFTGSDPILTVAKLKEMIKNKQVKYFMIPSGFSGNEILNWIQKNGRKIPGSEWGSAQADGQAQNELYEVKG